MTRVAGAWLTFSVLGGVVGISTFLILFFGFSQPNWIAILAGWAGGLGAGGALAPFRWARVLTSWLLYALYPLQWLN